MPTRSTKITLINNTPFTLTHFDEDNSHGTPLSISGVPTPTAAQNFQLPATVGPSGAYVTWYQQDTTTLYFSFSGTEGWVKYSAQTGTLNSPVPPGSPPGTLPTTEPLLELIYIYWDNPYIWNNTTPIDAKTSLTDITVPNQPGSGLQWPGWTAKANTPPPQTQFILAQTSTTYPNAVNWGTSEPGQAWDLLAPVIQFLTKMLACADPAFDGPVILFQDIIEILHGTVFRVLV
jgi:hypothetical protein